MSDLSKEISGLSADKRRLLELLMEEEGVDVGRSVIVRRDWGPDADAPVSHAQRRLWLIDRIEPDSAAYNMPAAFRLRGALDAAALHRALATIVARHETLRTTFAAVDGEPVQRVAPAGAPVPLPRVDLSALPAARRPAEAERLAAAEARRPFDLARGPLLRARLIRLAADDHTAVLNLHHIVSDGWSVGVLVGELAELYAAEVARRRPELPALTVQYRDFAAWQRERLDGERLQEELDWWRTRLAGAPPLLELPTDRPRGAGGRRPAESLRFALGAPAVRALRRLADAEGTTLFAALLAGFAALLARYSGQHDLVVGTPVAGRDRVEVEPLIGFFVNTLALRLRPDGDAGFRELLRHSAETVLAAHSHQDLPFEALVDELAPRRSLSHAPLFQVMFQLDNTAGGAVSLPGVELTPVKAESGRAKFDLTLTLRERDDGTCAAVLVYDAALFDRRRMERLGEHYRRLLTAAGDDPERPLDSLPILGASERRRLLDDWAGRRNAPPEESLASLFAATAERHAEETALLTADGALTYGALAADVRRLAGHLARRGVRPGDRVGVALERGAELIVALLAILRAGAAYVPLDAAYPRERLRAMAADAGLGALVTRDGRLAELAGGLPLIDLAAVERSALPDAAPHADLPPTALAYVMFTSGSTGRPKAVAAPHGAVARLVRDTDYCDFGPGTTWLLLAPVAFDASTLEMWGPLLNGGRLAVPPAGPVSLEDLERWVDDFGVTHLWLTTGLFHTAVDERLDLLRPLRRVMTGGDVMSPRHVGRVVREVPEVELMIAYGPTENTTFTTTWEVDEAPAGPVPLGRPIPGSSVYVLDRRLQPVPEGVYGELCTGGSGVAWGYLGRPARTAASFVPDPFGATPGGRLYRTGDLARWLPDGMLDFLGRRDGQVKVRGFRIELAEIEAALVAHRSVREAVVVARGEAGGKRLVAYVVAQEESALDDPAASLAPHLASRLPDYMVPAVYVRLDELPLNPNGKVDRGRLPAPETTAEERYVAPRDDTEATLAALWAELLEVERVGVHDDFFALGGQSLLATRVASRVRRAFGVELPVRRVFETPTVAGLARAVEELGGATTAAAPPLEPTPRDRDLPLSFAQERLWFIDRLEPGRATYNVPMALRLGGDLDAGALAAALGAVVRRHEVLRTVFADGADGPVQVIRPPAPLRLPRVDLAALPAARREAEARRLARLEAETPFDLAADPMLRAVLVRLDADDHALLLDMHHIASDGWSVGVLVDEVGELYRAARQGDAAELPELPVQYADYAAWQRDWLSGAVLEGELAWWREHLAGLPPVLELPTDRPRPAVASQAGAVERRRLDRTLSDGLAALADDAGATLFMVLLAGFQALLSRWADQRDFAVGSPVAGRTRVEVEPLIGFFVNTLVHRARLGEVAPDGGFRALLAAVREDALAVQGHQEVPFERLVERVAPERSLSHAPVFQVLIALQNVPAGSVDPGRRDLGGLSARGFNPPTTSAKFDLTLIANRGDDGIGLALEYASDLFDPSTARRLLDHLEHLLEAAVAAPETPLAALPLIDAAQRRQVVEEWNRTASAYPRHASLGALFTARAVRRPDDVAAVFPGRTLTYGELDALSAALAGELRRAGVGRGTAVGLAATRSPEAVVGALAVVRAGGAYVPLDPSYPRERLALMLADTAAPVVLAQPELADEVPAGDHRLLPLDLGELPVDGAPPAAPCDGDDLAYVIYTSGSTGRPKGVAVPHRAVARLVLDTDYVELGPGDRVAFASNLSFDAATFEIWGALLTGAALVAVPRRVALTPETFTAHLAAQRVSHLFVTTALFNSVAAETPDGFAGLDCVMFGGEACDPAAVRRVLAATPPRRLLHVYGPTESTTFATWQRVTGVAPDAVTVPIGRPIANTRAYVVDRALRPQPVAVPGELVLAGDGLARGYLGRPRRTAASFVPDPFAAAPGGRLYRTGDLVRRLPGGAVEFLGRVDDQVKIRGFRIEPGEVAAVLADQPEVAKAAVVVREAAAGRQLVGYLVPADGAAADPDELPGLLAARLRDRLPEYMQPAALMVLDALPLNPNGKVDRRALPAPDLTSAAYVEPRTPVESELAAIWRELLGVERVGAEDDFFRLGGHSLLATRVSSRVRQAFGVELPVRRVFESPTVAGLAAAVEELRGAGPAAATLTPVQRDRALPLSFAQERLWFIDRLEPGSATYNIPVALRLDGALERSALAAAFTAVAVRHEVLRTVYRQSAPAAAGGPVQVVTPAAPVPLPLVDLSALPGDRCETAARALARAEANRPFDLAAGPVLRTTLVRLAPGDHLLVAVVHHIAADGWSVGLMIREIGELYRARTEGRAPRLPELPVQYADYAARQRERLSGAALEAELAWWSERLAGLPPLLELPTDRPRPPVASYRGDAVSRRLDDAATGALRAVSRNAGATLFMTLMAGWQTLLARWAGQEDFAVGSPVAGRTEVAVEPLIGFFVNTLVHRAALGDGALGGGPSFHTLLAAVREEALAVQGHQEVPFARLVERVAPERSLAHPPVFQVVFALQNVPRGASDLGGGLTARPFAAPLTRAKVDVALIAVERGGGLELTVEYARDLFDAATAGRLLGHLERLLAAAAAAPETPVAALPLMDEAERRQVVDERNRTAADYRRDASLAALFAAQVARRPEAPAVVDGERRVTYAELDALADAQAAALRRAGVVRGSVVGLAAERGLDAVAGMLAVAKAGGAYLPLDVSHPAQRLAGMLADAGARLLLVQPALADRLPDTDLPRLALDPAVAEPAAAPLPDPCGGDDLANVIFTSGSTGRPKGVAVSHRGVARLVAASVFDFGPGDRVVHSSSLAFDASTLEIWSALLNGACLLPVPPEIALEPPAFAAFLERHEVTSAFVTTALFNSLCGAAPEAFGRLRTLAMGGEAADAAVLDRLFAAGAPHRVLNLYGPTEVTVAATGYVMTEAPQGGTVPIGRPLSNQTAYVLDRRLEPQPVGVPGELFVGGDGLARGYVGRPAGSAAVFLPDPFAEGPGARMYRTGDLVRWLPDGDLEFLGRVDEQVKIRGFRIEPGEVAAVLAAQPEVAQAVVVPRDGAGGRRLVAYAVPAGEARDDLPDLLLRRAAARLPDYMLPAALVLLDELPLTANGKLDRRALPAPDTSAADGPHVAPRTPVESELAALWAGLLGVERVGVEDDFFRLGGHSLLATRVTSRIRRTFGVEVPVRRLFETPTVAGLAAAVERRLGERAGAAAPPLEPVARDRELPLSFSQERLWFIDRLEPGRATYNVPLALRLEGELERGRLATALTAVVRRHEVLRTVYAEREGRPVQVVRPAAPVPLPLVDLSALPDERREEAARRLARRQANRPFDLAAGPVLRACLLRLGAGDHLLVAVLHHIASDGWSLGVLLREVSEVYRAAGEGRAPSLPELPVQYADYAAWQRDWLSGEVLETELGWWQERLAGLPPLLELPTDRPRPAVASYRGASVEARFDAALTGALRDVAADYGGTLFMTLLAGFQVLLGRWSGQTDFAVGAPVAGRTRVEVEPLIGFFVNTLVHRARLRPGAGFSAHVARLREEALAVQGHQEVPFERLVERVAPERSLSHAPVFQVLFALQNVPGLGAGTADAGDGRLGGLTARGVEAPLTAVKFDLTLAASESGDGLGLTLEYASDLFDAATAERMLGHLERLLAAAVADPGRPVDDLPLLSDGERRQLVENWAGERNPLPPTSVTARFAAMVERRAGEPALVTADGALSYAELAAEARRLAGHLAAVGVRPGDRVGVALGRGAELIVTLLAILEAGAAYVPLDADYPEQRLRFMADDAGLAALVTRDGVLAELAAGRTLIDLAEVDRAALPDVAADTLPGRSLPPETAAYVMYTSGSTGRPKGVVIPHRGIVRLVCGTSYAEFSPATTLLFLAPVAFDASTLEMWGPLLNGGRLAVPPAEEVSLDRLQRWIEDFGVSDLFLTAGLFHTVVDERPGALAPLARLMSGGDVLSPRHVARVVDELPGVAMVNAYGPTENTTVTTACVVGEPSAGPVPIGAPIPGTSVYVLDRRMAPVPVGVYGELYTGGDGLALGYLGRPARTAAAFVPDPFAERPGGRLYRTGDLVRWRRDGKLDFLGRRDGQVKVRGFRIELGEIETALAAHPAVRETVVLARGGDAGGKRLVAWVVPEAGEDLEDPAAGLAPHLARRLPEYMVPSAWVRLDEMPRTAHGKVDRRALPEPAAVAQERAYVAPRTAVEGELAAIWSALLDADRVGVHDDFFRLGGHSLLATRLVSRVRDLFAVELPVRRVFETPTVAGLAAAVEGALGAERGAAAPPLEPVERRPGEPLPLSYAQERLWFIDRLEPGRATYNIPQPLRLAGGVDATALAAALTHVVARHEVLRTVYAEEEGAGVQVVRPAAPFALRRVDLSALPETAREAEARRLARADARRPFDLTRDPMLRATLVRLAADDQLLLLTQHHIASDGWSVGVLLRELGALYRALRDGRPAELPALPVQYADYAVWQRGWLRGDVLEAELAWWRHRLAGLPPLLELPTDRPRPATASYRGATVSRRLPAELSAAVAELGAERGATLFMTLLGAVQVLLARWSGQDDFALGSPIAGRNHVAVEPLIGFFVNTLVHRAAYDGDAPFGELLGRVREEALEVQGHQELPFERLVERVAPERSLSHAPVFQVLLAFQNVPAVEDGAERVPGGALGSGLDARGFESGAANAKFDLSLAAARGGSGALGLTLEYATDLFDAVTAERLLDHLERLLAAAVADPGQPVGDLPLMSAGERGQLLDDWGRAPSRPRPTALHSLFVARARRTPDAVALVAGEESLTYGALERRSRRLALRLRAAGVGAEVPVAVALPRTPVLPVALLAVLRAGGAYVPLDPDYPAERLRFVLGDLASGGAAPVLLTDSSLAGGLPAGDARTVLVDDDDAGQQGATPDAALPPVAGDQLAYVIYTSGSTGRPKGVAIEHRSAAALVAWALELFTARELAGVLAATSVSFDLSVFELFVPLAAGGTVVLAANALALPELPARDRVTLVNTVPSALAELVRGPGLPPGVRTVNLAGEALPRELADRIHGLGSVERLYNLYGPSEDTTYSTWALVTRDRERAPSIGRPVDGTRAYLLDRRGRLVPPGVVGELHLGGDGLSRGYLHRPALTAERYVPDPFGAVPGGRLYRTGDLARWAPDGRLDFLGRRDHQVKVRGFRIELGEIEAVLGAHPAVYESAVVVRDGGEAGPLLAAYVVAEDGARDELTGAELAAHLGARLPDHMVPSVWTFLDALPRTPNGKVDRAALPAPERGAAAGHTPPRSAEEAELAALWGELLGVERVGVHDDFFRLGGHSLLATRLVFRVRRRFGVELPLASLFTDGTVARQAALLRRLRGGAAEDGDGVDGGIGGGIVVPLRRDGDGTPLFLVHGVGGNVLSYHELARRLERPVHGLQTPAGGAGADVGAMAATYAEAVERVRPEGPLLLAGWSMGALVAFEMARRLRAAGREVERVVLLDPPPAERALRVPGGGVRPLEWFVRDWAGVTDADAAALLAELPETDGAGDGDVDGATVETLARRLRRCGALPEDADPALVRRLYATFRANLEAMTAYDPRPCPGRVDVVLAMDTPETDEMMRAGPDRGWGDHAGRLVLHRMAGDHYSVLRPPAVGELAERFESLREEMEEKSEVEV